MSFPLADFDDDPAHWDGQASGWGVGGVATRRFHRSVPLGLDHAFMGAQEWLDGGAVVRRFGKVEINPSRVIEGAGVSLASAADSVSSVLAAVELASAVMAGPAEGDPLSECRVRRIDVARDFEDVDDAAGLLRSLAPIPRRWARRNLIHADPQRGGAETLMVGSGSGVVRAYDKFKESQHVDAIGVVRFEVEARKGWATRYASIGCLGDVGQVSVELLARDRWEWSAMGLSSQERNQVVAAVMAAEFVNDRERLPLIGWLVAQAEGVDVPVSKVTAAKYRRYQLRLGLAAVGRAGQSTGGRLDFESGKFVPDE